MSGLEARGIIEASVRRELFGPADDVPPIGTPIDCSLGTVHFGSKEASRGQFHDASTLQEILTQSNPLRRYGIGVLHGGAIQRGTAIVNDGVGTDDTDISWVSGLSDSEEALDGPSVEVKGSPRHDEADSDDFDLTDANAFKPSAMALSLKCRVPRGGSLKVTVRGAYYDRVPVHVPEFKKSLEWWLRRPFELIGTVPGRVLLDEIHRLKTISMESTDKKPRLAPTVHVYSRPVPGASEPDQRLVTIAVTNQAANTGPANTLFQMGFSATAQDGLLIEAYPEVEHPESDDEQRSIDLLYRNKRTYAIGHGCAAGWDQATEETVPLVRAESLPAYEVVSLTPDVYDIDEAGRRSPVTVSMAALAEGKQQGHDQVELVLARYEQWIDQQDAQIPDLLPRFQRAAERHMALCRDALQRMQTGWRLVATNPIAAGHSSSRTRRCSTNKCAHGFP